MKIVLCAVVGSLIVAGLAAAQESKIPPPPPLWSGKAEMSFVSTSGNTDTQTFGAGAEVEYQPGVWSGKTKVDYLRAEAGGKENARLFAFLLRGESSGPGSKRTRRART